MFAGFPYDNICTKEESVTTKKDVIVRLVSNVTMDISVTDGRSFFFCDQYSWLNGFPPEGLKEAPEDQKEMVYLFGVVSIIAIVFFSIHLFGNVFYKIKPFFVAHYKPEGDDTKMDFSSCLQRPGVLAYLPFINIPGFNFVCFGCDIRGFTTDLIGWKDENTSHAFYSMIDDVPYVPVEGCQQRPIFSIAKYWPRFPDDS